MDSYDFLVDALSHADRVVQADAARLLGELGRATAAQPLVGYVTTSRYHAKTAGFWALARLGDPSVCGALRPLIDNPNCYDDYYWYGCRTVRAAAAFALLALGDDEGAGYLIELADNGDDVFYAWLAPALLSLPTGSAALEAIRSRLTCESLTTVRTRGVRLCDPGRLARVAEALGVLATEDACRKLCELLGFRSRYVRGQAAISLLAASRAEPHVAAVRKLAAADATDFVRIKTAQALGEIEPIAAASASADDPFDRAAAIEAVGLLGAAESFAVALSALADCDPYVRLCAVEALDRIGGHDAGPAVRRLEDDPEIRVRLQVAKFLCGTEGGKS